MVSDKYPRKPSDSNFSFQAMVMATTMELETIMTIMDRAMEREMEMRTETTEATEPTLEMAGEETAQLLEFFAPTLLLLVLKKESKTTRTNI